MKKVLILTTSTGEGHNQAASSIGAVFKEKGFEVIKSDFLENNSKLLASAFVGGYSLSASTFPKLYGLIYKLSNMKLSNRILSILFFSTKHKVLKLINTEKPDLIVLTHPFVVSIIADLKKKINIPTISIVTDFKAHHTYVSKRIDAYITGSSYTKEHLIRRGIDGNKIHPLGIPIRREFFNHLPEISSTKDTEYFNILLMSGSMGLKNISFVLKELLNNKHKLRITVVCGNNNNLKATLLKEYSSKIKDKKLHILGFSRDIDSLMEYSDLIISKPGGLTSTEAICKNLPLIIPFVIPGQESENCEFLTTNGYALKIDNLIELNYIVDDLIENPSKLSDMKENLKILSSTYSLDGIIDLANDLLK